MKRVVSLLLVICVLLGLFVNVSAVSASDISDNQLFLQYPQYLGSQEALSYVNNANDLCQKIINSQNQTGTVIATILDDGLSIGLQNIAAKLKWGRNYQDSITENAAIKFMEAVAGPCAETFINQQAMSSKISKPFSLLSNVNDALDKNQATQLITSVLSELGVKNASSRAPELYDAIQKKMPFTKAVKYGTEGWKGAVATLKLFSFQYSTVTCLMDSVDSSTDLYKGLKMVKEDMQDPAKYFVNHYLKDAILREIGGFVSNQSGKIIGKAIGLSDQMLGVISLGKTVYFTFIYDGYKVDDFAEAVALLSFASTLDSKLSNLRIKFQQGNGTQGDIQTYKTLFYYDTCAYVAALNGAAGLLSVRNHYDWKGDAEVLAVNIGSKWVGGYDWYFTTCKKALANDLNNGKAVPVKNNSGSSSNTGTTPNTGYSTSSLRVSSTVNKTQYIVTPSRTVNLYKNPTDTSRYDYFSRSVGIWSDCYVILSDGSYRYEVSCVSRDVSMKLWLDGVTGLAFYDSKASAYPSVTKYVNCHKYIYCPNRVVDLYANPNDSSRYDYFSKGQNVASARYAILSDGSVWYEIRVSSRGQDVTLWLKDASDLTIETSHTFGNTLYEDAHPHNGYRKCECGQVEYTGTTTTMSNCAVCVPPHTHAYGDLQYEVEHPHREYKKCSCGDIIYTGNTGASSSCSRCDGDFWLRSNVEYFYLADMSYHELTFVPSGHVNFDLYINDELYDVPNALPLRFPVGTKWELRNITGDETFDYIGLLDGTTSGVIGTGAVNILFKLEPKHRHNYVHYDAKPATCTEDGNIEYWCCENCRENGTQPSYVAAGDFVKKEQVLLKAPGHNFVNDVCTNCGIYRLGEGVHFKKTNSFVNSHFSDVESSQWYYRNVADVYDYGLMKGISNTQFNPKGDITLAEAITVAARIHSMHLNGSENFKQTGNNWYDVYREYAYQNNIISWYYYNPDLNLNQKATRADFAMIFANVLPGSAFVEVNKIADNFIPDVSMSMNYASNVYKLYRAGVLTGSDKKGTFNPNSSITRAEAAAIVTRIIDPTMRQTIN